jgi:hypothetical protein
MIVENNNVKSFLKGPSLPRSESGIREFRDTLYIKRHIQSLTSFHSKLDQTIIYRYPVLDVDLHTMF